MKLWSWKGKGLLCQGVLNYMNVHDCFFLGRVHAGASPSTVMNNFILHTTAFLSQHLQRVITGSHLCRSDVSSTEASP